MIKKLLILLVVLTAPLILGLLFTYQIIHIDWVSFMEIQPSYRAQEDPLPLPVGSVPITGAAYLPGMGAPVNPVPGDGVSLQRGKQLYEVACVPCHGAKADGKGPFAAFLANKPANLLQGSPVTDSDGAMFLVITTGVPGRMPPMIENLPQARDRWDVVNYVRSLQK
jgi:mono/diheme cytochrome c family protein